MSGSQRLTKYYDKIIGTVELVKNCMYKCQQILTKIGINLHHLKKVGYAKFTLNIIVITHKHLFSPIKNN